MNHELQSRHVVGSEDLAILMITDGLSHQSARRFVEPAGKCGCSPQAPAPALLRELQAVIEANNSSKLQSFLLRAPQGSCGAGIHFVAQAQYFIGSLLMVWGWFLCCI